MKTNIGILKRICRRCVCRSTADCNFFLFTVGLLLSVCCIRQTALAEVIVDSSLTAVVGATVNLSCSSASEHSLDIYYQQADGASPLPVYANNVILEQRYDVAVSSFGECRGVAARGRHHVDTLDESTKISVGGDDGGVCWYYVLIIDNVQLYDIGLYSFTKHGAPIHNALRTVRLTVIDDGRFRVSTSTYEQTETPGSLTSTMSGFTMTALTAAAVVTVTLLAVITGVTYCLCRRLNIPRRQRGGLRAPVECTDEQQNAPLVV